MLRTLTDGVEGGVAIECCCRTTQMSYVVQRCATPTRFATPPVVIYWSTNFRLGSDVVNEG